MTTNINLLLFVNTNTLHWHCTVERLNTLLVRAVSLHLLESQGTSPGLVMAAGDWGRAWQECGQKYRC